MAEQRMLGPDDVAVVIPALNEALRIRERASAAALKPVQRLRVRAAQPMPPLMPITWPLM